MTQYDYVVYSGECITCTEYATISIFVWTKRFFFTNMQHIEQCAMKPVESAFLGNALAPSWVQCDCSNNKAIAGQKPSGSQRPVDHVLSISIISSPQKPTSIPCPGTGLDIAFRAFAFIHTSFRKANRSLCGAENSWQNQAKEGWRYASGGVCPSPAEWLCDTNESTGSDILQESRGLNRHRSKSIFKLKWNCWS